jgi:replicative DNA helicase
MESTTSSRITPLRDPEPGRVPQPPANTEAEQALLGAILVNNVAHARVSEFLLPEHFSTAVHGRIYAAIGKLIERGEHASPVALKNRFDQEGALAEIGGAQYLVRLAECAVTIINAEHYGRIIHNLYKRRELATIGQDIVTDAYREDLDDLADEQIERAEKKLFELATASQSESRSAPNAAAIKGAIEQIERAYKGQTTGIPTGLLDLEKKLGGLHRSDLVILAGRPSMGKTALAIDIALAAARTGHWVYFFSLEMSKEQLGMRQLAIVCGVSAERQRIDPSREDMYAAIAAQDQLDGLKIQIDDSAILSVAQIHTRARRHQRQQGLGLIVIDYLQLLSGGDNRSREENRVQQISGITRGLKAVARELDVPVLALAQLSRAVEQREDKRPHLTDLRESGSIEQDADVVMFIFREEYYLARDQPQQRSTEKEADFRDRIADHDQKLRAAHELAEIIIAKNRHGGIATVKARFDAQRTSFENLAWGESR